MAEAMECLKHIDEKSVAFQPADNILKAELYNNEEAANCIKEEDLTPRFLMYWW